ncbi:type III-B CRISPR module-associated protein Cmr5 [Paenibacillus sp. 1001270B_150601_E10]|uniref:type III-B CRISPR module-associated protein Cmr5 n=1 Tax=Paenibacillus sp. 1001270B_150601_E10 TaxID=2787079 RepID=UPI00189F2483|nr:type III-B CRISPR module-associated protein Cmr5 [Paenibacillus sp. 1001270B_150601_E10]
MRSTDHHYAKVAYNGVLNQSQSGGAQAYGRLCHKFPSMVMLNGLRLTIAYFRSNNKEQGEAYKAYLKDLGQALEIQDWEQELPEQSAEYRQLSRKALRASIWFKRYAEAILKVEEADE